MESIRDSIENEMSQKELNPPSPMRDSYRHPFEAYDNKLSSNTATQASSKLDTYPKTSKI